MKPQSTLLNQNNRDSPISVTSPLLNNSSLYKKAQEMIRKKASLYGFQELSNPLLYDRYNIVTSSIPAISRTYNRAKSNLVSDSSRQLQNFHHKESSQQTTKSQSRVKIPSIPTAHQSQAVPKRINLFPQLHKLQNLIHNQKQILHVFKDKLDTDINDVVFQYLKILSLSITKESQLNSKTLSPQKSILIPTLQFVSESLFQCQFDKMTLMLASIAVSLCQFYKLYDKIGKFLFLIAKVLRKMSRFQQTLILLKKALQYSWFGRRKNIDQKDNNPTKISQNQPQIKIPSNQKESVNNMNLNQVNSQNVHVTTQLEIYNQLSYCLLQLNQKKQSHIFASKYEIGYCEKDGSSNVMGLSKDLIISAQKRIVSWQRVDQKRVYMMIGCDLNKYLEVNKQKIMKKFNQNLFLKDLNASIDLMIQSLLKKQMFFYEIPLVTQFKDQDVESYKKSHSTNSYRKGLQSKFVYKRKSTHNRSSSISVKNDNKFAYNSQGIGESKIFNYRGIGLSRTKLVELLKNYINLIKKISDEQKKQMHHHIKLPQLNYDRTSSKKKTTQMEQSGQLGGISYNSSRKKTTIVDSIID